MKFICWNEICQIEVECDCGLPCCQGFTLKPAIIDLEKEGFTEDEKIDLVLHHICPNCQGWVEC